MVTVPITGGPVKGGFVSRMLSHLPITFLATSGLIEVLVEEMEEVHGNLFSFVGRVVFGAHTGARVAEHYDCSAMTGTMELTSDGTRADERSN
jgi:hypothetical protein